MLRLAELLAAVSPATDLADDAPLEALPGALTTLDMARLAGLGGDDLSDVYFLALLNTWDVRRGLSPTSGSSAAAMTSAHAGGSPRLIT